MVTTLVSAKTTELTVAVLSESMNAITSTKTENMSVARNKMLATITTTTKTS